MAGSVGSRLSVTRPQILAFRRRVGALDERMPMGSQSLRRAAWAGLQDSMPRAALISLHARIDGVDSSTWEDPALVQLWGPRYHTYVVAKRDFALFSLGRLPDNANSRLRAERIAERLHAHLDGTRMTDREVGRGLLAGRATPTGTLEQRVHAASDFLNHLGGTTDVHKENRHFEIRGYGCPLAAATSKYPEACNAMESLLNEFVGAPVAQCCNRHAPPRCCFEVGKPGRRNRKTRMDRPVRHEYRR